MSELSFSFDYASSVSSQTTDQSLTVLRFSGKESMSSLYCFEILVKQTDLSHQSPSVNARCALQFISDGTSVQRFTGIMSEVEEIKFSPASSLGTAFAVYRVVLEPELAKLRLNDSMQIYPKAITASGETIEGTLTDILSDLGWTNGLEYRFDFTQTQRNWTFRLQYNETQFDFLQRILEREGIFYFFEQYNNRELVVFIDSSSSFSQLAAHSLNYQPETIVDVSFVDNTVKSFNWKSQSIPNRVTVANFNDESPSLDISHSRIIDADGHGQTTQYGASLVDTSDAIAYADLIANSYLCRQHQYSFESASYGLRPGFYFSLTGHDRTQLNSINYVIETINHVGEVVEELNHAEISVQNTGGYACYGVCLQKQLSYAPLMRSDKPKVQSTLLAKIEGVTGQNTPLLDDCGRYRVKFLFDSSQRVLGQCSYWIRKIESFGGAAHGTHFPLIPGSRVLVGFLESDPDRPVIVGCLTDSSNQKSVVNDTNNQENTIITAGENKLVMDDTVGQHSITLSTPTSIALATETTTFIKLSQQTTGGNGFELDTHGIDKRRARMGQSLHYSTQYISEFEEFKFPRLNYFGQRIAEPTNYSVIDWQASFGPTYGKPSAKADYQIIDTPTEMVPAEQKAIDEDEYKALVFSDMEEELGRFIFERRYGHRYEWSRGNRYVFGEDNLFDFGNSYEEYHVYEEGIDRNNETFDIPTINNFNFAASGSQPSTYDCNDDKRAGDPGNHAVLKRWGDQFNYHFGRRFEWCSDPADYNFANGYTENLVKSDNEVINAEHPHDRAKPSGPKYKPIDGSLVTGITASAAAATKTIGDAYNYRNGKVMNVDVGNTESYVHGDSHTEINGNCYEITKGTITSVHEGFAKTIHRGNADSEFESNSSEIYKGAHSSVNLGATSNVQLGAASDFFLGVNNDMRLGVKHEFQFGPVIKGEYAVGTRNYNARLEAGATRVTATLSQIGTGAVNLYNRMNVIENTTNALRSGATSISNRAVRIRTGIVQLFS